MWAIARLPRTAAKLLVQLLVGAALLSTVVAQQISRVPAAPTRVVAVPLQGAAVVAWMSSEKANDEAAIGSYTIAAFDNVAPTHASVSAQVSAPGAEVVGLTANHCYWFRVRATNRAGDSPDSEPSELTCLPPLPGADLEAAVTTSDSAESQELIFTVTVTNHGVADAPSVLLEDVLLVPISSFETSQGVCHHAPGGMGLKCVLGAMAYDGKATITIRVTNTGTELTNSVSVKAFDNAGAPLYDPDPENNTATLRVRPHTTPQ
jgi:hypothetical protein